ncbi:MAG: terminase family protein [Clostridia bacterium]|nr:terminase family protein [Clostridia bacterium]
MSDRAIWRPQERQAAFLERSEYEAFYGGAAGGGKSMALIMEALRQVKIPHYRGLILRKTYPQLSDIIDVSRFYYKKAYPRAKYNETAHCWTFPSGSKIYFGSMHRTADRTNYQGKQYDFIGFDELTQFTWDEYSYLFSRNRPSGPGTLCYVRATGNPGGIGHGWVKERFITPAPAGTPITQSFTIRLPNGKAVERTRKRIFIPSSVFDNPALLSNAPEYLESLAMLPAAEREALLYGSWDSFSGQVFSEWRDNPDGYMTRINSHVVLPFRIPKTWRVFRSFDFGYSKPFSVGWYAVDHDGRLWRIRELYGSDGNPNVGIKWDVSKIAQEIRRIESEDENLKGRRIDGVADPAIWAEENSGSSTAALFEKFGVYFEKGDNSRISGKMQCHYRLRFDENGIPMFYVFSSCKNFIRTVPSLVYSPRDTEDVDTTGEDHIYDEWRYVCMLNPIAPPAEPEKVHVPWDPLSSKKSSVYDWWLVS